MVVPLILAAVGTSGILVAESISWTAKRFSQRSKKPSEGTPTENKYASQTDSYIDCVEIENHLENHTETNSENFVEIRVNIEDQFETQVKEELQIRDDFFNIAVIAADNGSDKSSLISAIRGPCDGEQKKNDEMTVELGRYHDHYDGCERFVWYDVPDMWDISVPECFGKKGLPLFDLVIVAIGDHVTAKETEIPKHCEKFGIPVAIVRLKANQHIQNLRSSKRYQISFEDAREEFVNQTRASFKPDMKVYCISAEALRNEKTNNGIDERKFFEDLQAMQRKKFEGQ